MPQFMGGNNARCAVADASGKQAHSRHGREPVNRHSPQQRRYHNQHTESVKVNDDVVRPSLLKWMCGDGGAQHLVNDGIDDEQQHERARHPPSTDQQASQGHSGGQEPPNMRQPGPTHASW